jgi:tetratricopeptide (TPR) repeat protein
MAEQETEQEEISNITARVETYKNDDAPSVPGKPSSFIVKEDSSSMGSADHENEPPSMTLSLFVYWIIPLLIIAIFSRKVVDTTIPTIPIVDQPAKRTHSTGGSTPRSQPKTQRIEQFPTHWPTAYRDELETIRGRRRQIDGFSDGVSNVVTSSNDDTPPPQATVTMDTLGETTETTETTSSPLVRHSRNDPVRDSFHQSIQRLSAERVRDPSNLYNAIALAETMRLYDTKFHDGGAYELEALQLYKDIISTVIGHRKDAILALKPTDECLLPEVQSVNDEVAVDYASKSLDGLLCSLYTSMGKLYFMADMFERAVEAYDGCLHGDVQQPYYLDALNAKASSLLVLGKLEDAGRDFLSVIQHDTNMHFADAFSGLERVLEAKEDAVAGGWDAVVSLVESLAQKFELQSDIDSPAYRRMAEALNRLHHFLFTYHDKKTKNYSEAFRHLSHAFERKLSVLPPWVPGSEKAKIVQTKNVFHRDFWMRDLGSWSKKPIFIIGFVRSGSTLLERILDAHPMIAGTGENSLFNAHLGRIRDEIVQAGTQDIPLDYLTRKLGDEVVDEMEKRHATKMANTERDGDEIAKTNPERLVDKMLANYYNIGLLQMLYPNALILHVAREPMDSVFSAYKHEFPPGTLDYSSDFDGLSELYHVYRDLMEHWEDVFPGRIVHIRYEDMVKDFEGVARAIIKATELPWHDDVLQFHKKKQAVNTLSSTQVRKGIYTDSLKSWMRYEEQLQPLVKLLGDRVEYNFKTTLPGYSRTESVDQI